MDSHLLGFDIAGVDVITKIIIPISTFILGVFFTLLLKYYEQKRASFRSKVEEIVQLTNGWYNQLQAISVKIEEGVSDKVIKARVYEYVNNREILPKLLLGIEILKKNRRSKKLVAEVEGFLQEVTNYDPDAEFPEGTACANLLRAGTDEEESKPIHLSVSEKTKPVRFSRKLATVKTEQTYPNTETRKTDKKLEVVSFRFTLKELDRRLNRVVVEAAKLLR